MIMRIEIMMRFDSDVVNNNNNSLSLQNMAVHTLREATRWVSEIKLSRPLSQLD